MAFIRKIRALWHPAGAQHSTAWQHPRAGGSLAARHPTQPSRRWSARGGGGGSDEILSNSLPHKNSGSTDLDAEVVGSGDGGVGRVGTGRHVSLPVHWSVQ